MKVQFTAILKRFQQQAEKTGWTYINIPAERAQTLFPGNKRSFRVKGFIDKHVLNRVAIMPMGNGDFIMAVNAEMRKAIRKKTGDSVAIMLQPDKSPLPVSNALLECMQDEPKSLEFFYSLTPSHQQYFYKWIESAKTEETKAKRIALSVNALSKKMGYGEMLRYQKEQNNILKG